MFRAYSLARSLPSLLLVTAMAAPALSRDLPYERLAGDFLAAYDAADASPQTFDLHGFLDEQFLHVSAGIYDVYLPSASAKSEKSLEDYQRVVLALFESQDRWLEWLESEVEDQRAYKQAGKDCKTLRKWVSGWDLDDVTDGLEQGHRDLADVLDASDSVREALERYAVYGASGTALGLNREDGAREPIVLAAGRKEMVQMCALGGWIYPQHRSVFWQESIATWTHTYIDDVKFLAMQFAMPRSPGDYTSGLRMDTRIETGLEQQIVQLATNSMLANYFGEAIPPTLAGGLAVNLVIDLFGECATRADGDLRARRTQAREVFVPGGNPNGGILPPNLADSRWRSEQGSDHFVAALKRAMPKARRGPARFVLEDDRGRRGTDVYAPFLGSSAGASSLSADYYGDQLEFLRSYRSCFLNWLRERGAGSSSKRSSAAFANLLRCMARGSAETIEDTLANVYGTPLSSTEPGKDDLEGRFLAWLAKQR